MQLLISVGRCRWWALQRGTDQTIEARFWPGLSGESPENPLQVILIQALEPFQLIPLCSEAVRGNPHVPSQVWGMVRMVVASAGNACRADVEARWCLSSREHPQGFKNFCLKETARMWPWLSYMCHIAGVGHGADGERCCRKRLPHGCGCALGCHCRCFPNCGKNTSLIKTCPPLGPYSSSVPRPLWWS